MAAESASSTNPTAPVPVRALRPEDLARSFPLYVVWEITMKCDQPCGHCGSRAGRARPDELSADEAMAVADALATLGSREVTLIGGEAYLREDCEAIIRRLAGHGMRVTMQTGGRAFTADRAKRFREAGLSAVGVSIDGLPAAHDKLRGNLGSFAAAMRALKNAREVGMGLAVSTQINRLSTPDLEELSRRLRAEGVETWQLQLTGPLGRAADRPEWLLQPWEIVPVIDTLAKIQLEAAAEFEANGKKGFPFNVFANNNVGYFGPHEQVIRSRPGGREAHFRGCQAGIYVMGIESDGTVKACPTLPTEGYRAGNVREMKLADVWERSERMRFSRDRDTGELWGHCATCYYAETCKAGCSWTTHTFFGKRGNMPFCYHRVTQLKTKGLRERVVKVEDAPGAPYDHGRFTIVEEPWGGAEQP